MQVENYGKNDLTVYFYVKKLSESKINNLNGNFYAFKQD